MRTSAEILRGLPYFSDLPDGLLARVCDASEQIDIPAGTAIRFEPGQQRSVRLVEYGGLRVVYGFDGQIMGTPAYMSPEQARGEVDHRTDLWSLGVVLYEMVAGRPPFRADTDQGIIYALLTEEPEPLRKLRPETPPELERIVKGMLAKDPADRYPNLDALMRDLRAALPGDESVLLRYIGTVLVLLFLLARLFFQRRAVAAG